MPRQSSVPVESAIAALKRFIDRFRTAELPRWSDEVWQQISNVLKEMGCDWTPQCVYTNVTKDRRKILSRARMEMGIIVSQSVSEKNDYATLGDTSADENNNSSVTLESCSSAEINNNVSVKDMVLTEEEWDQIKPENTDGKLKLRSGVWSNVVASAIWLQFRMPCAFIFKRAEVRKLSEDNSYQIKFDGICKSQKCGNEIHGRAEKKNSQKGVIFELNVRDTRGESHEVVKRPFNGKRRFQAYKDLKTEGGAKFRKVEARKLMLPGDVEPPIVPVGNVLRQAKKEGIDKDLGIDNSRGRDVVRSIEDMALSSEFCDVIEEVGGLPFRVLYASPAQYRLYKEFWRLKGNRPSVSIDATGGLVNRLQRSNGTKSGHIFFNAIAINLDGTTACVNQMLSERNDSVTIATWLSRWVISGAPIPKETVCDYSRALLMGISRAFNGQTLKQYINDRFDAIISSVDKIPAEPTTFVRIDVAHFVHMICRWKSIKTATQRSIKDFFVRCVALMVECRTLETFRKVVILTVAVASHTHEDSVIDVPVPDVSTPKDARRQLENLISRGRVTVDVEKITSLENRDTPFRQSFRKNEMEEQNENIMSDNVSPIGEWVDGVRTQAQEMKSQGENLNPFYLPGFVEPLVKVVKEFPLWTAVGMPENTQRATSSIVEAYFKELKRNTLKHYTLPISAKKFIREQIKDNEETNCIFSGKIVQHNSDRLHRKQFGKAVDSKDVTGFGVGDIHILENISHTVEISSGNQEHEQVLDPDYLAFDNWKNKGTAVGFDKRKHNAEDAIILEDSSLFGPTLEATVDIEDEDVSNEEKKELHIHTQSDHSYSKLELKKNDNEELIYSAFENSLDNRADFSSPIVENLNRPTKKSKFFGAYPEIRQQNCRAEKNTNTYTAKASLLPNGSLANSVRFQKCTYYVRNTCAFDAVSQILATAGIDNTTYLNFLQKSSNKTLNFVLNFIKSGLSKNLLVERAQILANIFPPKAQGTAYGKAIAYQIDAMCNISTLIQHALSSEPSIIDIEKCMRCGRTSTTHSTTIAPNHSIISEKGFGALGEALQLCSRQKNRKCQFCNEGQCTLTRKLCRHMFIELDVRERENLKKTVSTSLGQFPPALHLGPNHSKSQEYRYVQFDHHMRLHPFI